MSQTSYHKVMVQIKSYTESVKCLIKYKAIGSSEEHETSCSVQDTPAKKSCIILAGKQDTQEYMEKREHAGMTQTPPKIRASFLEVFGHLHE